MEILAIHYWDTRPKFVPTAWSLNAQIVSHNFSVLHRDLPPDWQISHKIFWDKKQPSFSVSELCHRLVDTYQADVIIHRPQTKRHFFNAVALSSYDILAGQFENYDLIFTFQQDRFIINHLGANILVLMSEMMEGQHPHLCHQ